MKKIFFTISFLSIFFIFSSPVMAACNWRSELTTTNPELGTSQITGGCQSGESQAKAGGTETCTGTAPASTGSGLATTRYICCCSSVAPAKTEKSPLFTPPDFQIEIPGMEKLTTISCPETGRCGIPWIGQYVKGIYNYALAIAGILAAIVLMAGGIIWLISAGDASKIAQAKELITGSVVGLLILACSYIILIQINPNLINFSPLYLTHIESVDVTPTPSDSTSFSAKCLPVNIGDCAVSNMSGFGAKANQASGICMAESGGNAKIYNSQTRCTGGEYAVWGLFQFNLSANIFVDGNGNILNCPKAFNKEWKNSSPSCTVVDPALYSACVAAATDPKLSIANAQSLVARSGNTWGPWEANSKFCKF